MPVVAIDMELIAPASRENSIAFEVPIAWLVIPKDKPLESGSLKLNNLFNVGPNIAPKSPVKITAAIKKLKGIAPIRYIAAKTGISKILKIVNLLGKFIFFLRTSRNLWP